MKKSSIIGVLILCFTFWGKAQVRNEIRVPDPEGYRTLKCDFHIHTVFSDGLVWPTVRVDEAYREGLDAIALTEHLEYRPHRQDIIASHNRSYEIAEKTARNNQVILIRGSEITRPMAPGHFNAIFLNDCDALEQKEYMDSFKAARRQNAFIFWNHPGWDRQQPDTTLWWNEHTRLYEEGYMQGIEVANGKKYSPEAQRWCIEKKLTMIGTSDIHQPIQTDIDFARGQHRTMTFVFVRERSAEGIREALLHRRTAVYMDEKVIAEEQWLKELFEKSIDIEDIKRNEKSIVITLKNNSDLTFHLKKTRHNPGLVYFREYTIQPQCRHRIEIRLENNIQGGDINFEITNLYAAPNKGLTYSYKV